MIWWLKDDNTKSLRNGLNFGWANTNHRWGRGPLAVFYWRTSTHVYGFRLRLRPWAPAGLRLVKKAWKAETNQPLSKKRGWAVFP